VNREQRDWLAVRAAVEDRMRELRLSTAELARRGRMSETTVRAFRNGRSRPIGVTVTALNDGLGLPAGYLHAVAEGRRPEAPASAGGAASAHRAEDR
jgi:transcriptional regulator with XRE-family HTH domain